MLCTDDVWWSYVFCDICRFILRSATTNNDVAVRRGRRRCSDVSDVITGSFRWRHVPGGVPLWCRIWRSFGWLQRSSDLGPLFRCWTSSSGYTGLLNWSRGEIDELFTAERFSVRRSSSIQRSSGTLGLSVCPPQTIPYKRRFTGTTTIANCIVRPHWDQNQKNSDLRFEDQDRCWMVWRVSCHEHRYEYDTMRQDDVTCITWLHKKTGLVDHMETKTEN